MSEISRQCALLVILSDAMPSSGGHTLALPRTLIFSVAMVRFRIFGLFPGIVGIITGITMLVPANLGEIGVVVAMLSLIPTALWLILLSRAFFRTAQRPPQPAV